MQQNTPEWLEMRKGKIGASDCPIIMGVSPWTTPYELWERKLGLREEQQENEAMRRGKELEPFARAEFNRLIDGLVFPQIKIHPKYDWMMASLDGISDNGKCVVEIKCPANFKDHELALNGSVPPKYIPQLQHQMEVCGLDEMFYFSYYTPYHEKPTALIPVVRDQKYIDNILTQEIEFYRCMKEIEAPPLTDKDFIQKKDSAWRVTVAELQYASENLKKWEEKEKGLRESLILQSGNKNCMGFGVKLSKIVRKGNVDYSKIPEIQSIDLDKYRKEPSECWRITKM